VNIQDLIDDAKCYQTIRDMRWPGGVTCPHRSSDSVIKNGMDETQPHRPRYQCKGCRQRFDDLTKTIFAGHHQPLRTWIACLCLMGLNLSGLQIAQELGIHKDDVRAMIQRLRQGIIDRRPLSPWRARWNATKSMWWQDIRAIPSKASPNPFFWLDRQRIAAGRTDCRRGCRDIAQLNNGLGEGLPLRHGGAPRTTRSVADGIPTEDRGNE
jgi:transposase-like protein